MNNQDQLSKDIFNATNMADRRHKILNATNNRVDILCEDGSYKPPYQVLTELSAVWNSLQ